MTGDTWDNLFRRIQFINRKPSPVSVQALDDFEAKTSFTLPKSYRSFCSAFGACELSRFIMIAVPKFSGLWKDKCDLDSLNTSVRQGRGEFDEYCSDPS